MQPRKKSFPSAYTLGFFASNSVHTCFRDGPCWQLCYLTSQSFYDCATAGKSVHLRRSHWYLPQRVNVKFEGNSVFTFNYSDSFILNLLVISLSFIASYILSSLSFAMASVFFIYVYLISITLMFALTHWTKFPHSFYKAGLFILDTIDRERGISDLPEVVEG